MANSKRDNLMATLTGQGYLTGSVSDRLLAYERDVYVDPAPAKVVNNLTLSDYLTYGTTSAFNKLTIQ